MLRSPTGPAAKVVTKASLLGAGFILGTALSFVTVQMLGPQPPQPGSCTPTERYHMAESYRPGAPFRSTSGVATVLYSGTVKVWPSCLPASDAIVDAWFVDPDGYYTTDTRLRVRTDSNGKWSFQASPLSDQIQPYHVHLKVEGGGIRPMTTAVYPETSTSGGHYDLVVLAADSQGPAGYLDTPPSSGESKDAVDRKRRN